LTDKYKIRKRTKKHCLWIRHRCVNNSFIVIIRHFYFCHTRSGF